MLGVPGRAPLCNEARQLPNEKGHPAVSPRTTNACVNGSCTLHHDLSPSLLGVIIVIVCCHFLWCRIRPSENALVIVGSSSHLYC